MRMFAMAAAALVCAAAPTRAQIVNQHGRDAGPADPFAGTFVGRNVAGPVTVEITREGDAYVVTDRSASASPMRGEAQVDAAGVLRGEYVVRLLGITRRHRFELTPTDAGLQYRTTGQNTPLERYAIVDGSPEAQWWFEAIGGRQLASFDRYSSTTGGMGGGFNRETRASLCGDGTFSYRYSSSTSITGDGISGSSSSRDQGEGRWRIVNRSGAPILELRFNDGRIMELRLTRRGDDLYVDNERYLRGDRVC